MLVVAVAVLAAAWLANPTATEVTVFGMEVPVLCGFRRMTGTSCPGCGLTRSFSFMAHGLVGAAFRTHALGPVAFMALMSQIPYRGWRLWRASDAAEVTQHGRRGHASDQ